MNRNHCGTRKPAIFTLTIKNIELLRKEHPKRGTKHFNRLTGDMLLSLRVAARLLWWDTFQESLMLKQDLKVDHTRIDKNQLSSLRNVFTNALKTLTADGLSGRPLFQIERSFIKLQNHLHPISDFVKQYCIHFISNAHIDLAWLWRFAETIEVSRGTFESVLNLSKNMPTLKFTQSQAQIYSWIEEKYPELFKQIKKAIKSGKWEVIGGMWSEPDCNLIDIESFVRQILYGKRYFKQKLGIDTDIAWNVDSFGYTWNMPQFLQQSGLKNFVTQKIGWNDTNVFPYHLFWWEGPDGSRVLTYFPYKGYNLDISQENIALEVVGHLKQFEVNTGLKEIASLIGIGDHGGGPTEAMFKQIERLKRIPIYPRVKYATSAEYFSYLRSLNLDHLPVWRDELYLELHRGTYTVQSKVKKANRCGERLLAEAEKLSSLVEITQDSGIYAGDTIGEMWRKLLLNQFHDILPGSSIPAVYQDVMDEYERIDESANKIIDSSLTSLASNICTVKLKNPQPLVVFNTLSWKRTAPVFLPFSRKETVTEFSLYDSSGKIIPHQLVNEGDSSQILFMAHDVPAFGYKTYQFKMGIKKTYRNIRLHCSRSYIENRFFYLEVAPDTGYLSRIYDKLNRKEVLSSDRGNMLELLEDVPEWCKTWNIKLTGKKKLINKADEIQLIEKGPVRAIIRVKKSFVGEAKKRNYPPSFLTTPGVEYPSSFFIQDIILYKEIARIDFRIRIDWWEDNILLKVSFPVNVHSSKATYEIPGAAISRPTTRRKPQDKAKFEVPALRWADLSDHSYGISLINDSKYGYDIHRNRMRLTLLKSPTGSEIWHTPDPCADRGKHDIKYSLFPHKGNWKEAGTVRKGYEFNYPLLVKLTGHNQGRLPLTSSFVDISPQNIILTTLKKTETHQGYLLRLYESCGRQTLARIKLSFVIDSAILVDIMEQEQETLEVRNNAVEVNIQPFTVTSLIIKIKS